MAVMPAGVLVYVNDELSGAPTQDEPPVGATPMRCCGAWEEDENAVDWSSGRDGNGFLHWPGKRCR